MRADSVTDAHLAQLDATKVRRVAIDGVRFAHGRRRTLLRVGGESLRRFAAQKNFPTLVLDRCSVTTKIVCDYTEVRRPFANLSKPALIATRFRSGLLQQLSQRKVYGHRSAL